MKVKYKINKTIHDAFVRILEEVGVRKRLYYDDYCVEYVTSCCNEWRICHENGVYYLEYKGSRTGFSNGLLSHAVKFNYFDEGTAHRDKAIEICIDAKYVDASVVEEDEDIGGPYEKVRYDKYTGKPANYVCFILWKMLEYETTLPNAELTHPLDKVVQLFFNSEKATVMRGSTPLFIIDYKNTYEDVRKPCW